MLNKILLFPFHLLQKNKVFGGVLFLYLISLIISFPEKLQTIGKRHQDIVAHQLVTFKIWEKKGFWNCQGGLILTYPNPGDINLKADPIQTNKNANGEYFYFSYPPFNFYSTYFLLKLFHLPIDDFWVRNVDSFFLLLNVIAFYFLFKEYSFIPILIYLFIPNVLWFHHNVWFVDIQVITFILWAFYFSFSKPVPFFICIFLACFTEWWAFLFVFSLILYVWLLKKNIFKPSEEFPVGKILIDNNKNIFITVFCALTALISYILINANIIGWYNFFDGIHQRLITRMGINHLPEEYFFVWEINTFVFIIWYYLRNYLFSLLLIVFLWLIGGRKILQKENLSYLFPLLFSIFLHHVILLNWTAAHDFSVLKFSIIIPFLMFHTTKNQNLQKNFILWILIVSVLYFQISKYYHHKNVPRLTKYIQLAECVKQNYSLNEIAKAHYYKDPLIYLWWKSERNVIRDSLNTKCK